MCDVIKPGSGYFTPYGRSQAEAAGRLAEGHCPFCKEVVALEPHHHPSMGGFMTRTAPPPWYLVLSDDRVGHCPRCGNDWAIDAEGTIAMILMGCCMDFTWQDECLANPQATPAYPTEAIEASMRYANLQAQLRR